MPYWKKNTIPSIELYKGTMAILTLLNHWVEDGHYFVRWAPESQQRLRMLKCQLGEQLKNHLSGRCAHLKGWGGVKGAIRRAQALANQFPYVARLDIRGYYERINHVMLLAQLSEAGVDRKDECVVAEYLTLPDVRPTGCGMVAGGAISPLLGALYLTPLDRLMHAYEGRYVIRYQRYRMIL